jgi:hypothetical protein
MLTHGRVRFFTNTLLTVEDLILPNTIAGGSRIRRILKQSALA